MAEEPRSPQVVRFGVFEVDLRAGELRKQGLKIKLQEQPLQVLALLLERRGQVVTREELKQKLWTADTIVSFDHSLNTAINKLREVLGDSAESPRFVETLPRRGYRFIYPVERGDVASIAVLPLKNLSGDPTQDYFADGMTDSLITELGKISTLRVLSYRSVLGYRQTTKPLPEIARELKVDALLEGAVLHSGNRVRITANLVQAMPERHLWAESFEFDQGNVLAVQGEVARDVARQARVKLTPQEQARLTNSRPVDPEAHEAYLLGRAYAYKAATRTSWTRAKEYLEKAIEKDPGYAPAYASLADLSMRRGSLTRDPRDLRLQARQWAEEALKLDDTLAEAHTALARVAQQEWDWAGAEREYRRAIELNPSYPIARVRFAMFLYAMQRFEEAVVQANRAQQLEPVSPFINTWAGAAYFLAGRVQDATASWQRALELDPGYSDASVVLARTHLTLGMTQQAIAELQKALTFNASDPLVLGALAHVYAQAGRRQEALKLVGDLKRIAAEGDGFVPVFGIVWAYAGLGDKEQAFVGLERCYRERSDRMVWLNVDPLLAPLRSDPRFHDFVRRVGLPTKSPAQPR